MIRKVIALAGGAAVVAGLALAGAGAAMASPRANPDSLNPTVVFTGPSDDGGLTWVTSDLADSTAPQPCAVTLTTCTAAMAGYYVSDFATTATEVDATFTLNAEAAGIGVSCIVDLSPASCWSSPVSNPKGISTADDIINGAIGAQLCQNVRTDEGDGFSAQIGAANLGPIGFDNTQEFAIGFVTGYLNGLTTDPCVGGGVLPEPLQFNTLGSFAVGQSVQAQIKQEFSHNRPSGLLFSGQLVNGVTDYSYFLGCRRSHNADVKSSVIDAGCDFYPNEAGAGVQADTSGLSAPASNDLTDFSGVTAEFGGVTHGFAAWNAVKVEGSQDGIAPPLLTPTALNASTCTRTFHPGHREYFGPKGHRTGFKWLKGYWTSAGCGPNSFSVDAGTPVS